MSAGKNPSRIAAGLKAAVHNPRVSEEAKESATERLQQMGAEAETTQETATQTERASPTGTSQRRHSTGSEAQMTEGKSESRVMGGYKAALKNPRVSEEAKEHAEEILEQHHVHH
ncbi:Conidiation protein 6 domain containing protein [Amanita muscaria]